MKKSKTIEVDLELGELKAAAADAAKASGVSLNEYICNAIESRIRQHEELKPNRFVRHGGKHLMGKHTGYEVTEDGRYYPAPSWTDQFDQLFAERTAIYDLINAVYSKAQERLIEVEKQIGKAKARLVDDLGLDLNKNWVYYGSGQNCVKEVEQDKGESEEAER